MILQVAGDIVTYCFETCPTIRSLVAGTSDLSADARGVWHFDGSSSIELEATSVPLDSEGLFLNNKLSITATLYKEPEASGYLSESFENCLVTCYCVSEQ